MCLIVFAYQCHPAWRLILAANRDEFYARPSASMAYWHDAKGVLAGRDLTGGGTWFGVTRAGRFAAVTNYRDPHDHRENAPSRGLLVADFLRGDVSSKAYLDDLLARADQYNGFSLLVGDRHEIYYFCDRENVVRELAPGLYGLSNGLLDTPWPKVERAKQRLAALVEAHAIDTDHLLAVLADEHRPADDELPDTGVSLEWERRLSPILIRSPDYGTRSSTALLIGDHGQVAVAEHDNLSGELKSYRWRLEPE